MTRFSSVVIARVRVAVDRTSQLVRCGGRNSIGATMSIARVIMLKKSIAGRWGSSFFNLRSLHTSSDYFRQLRQRR